MNHREIHFTQHLRRRPKMEAEKLLADEEFPTLPFPSIQDAVAV